VRGSVSLHELLITLFLFLTAPVTAQMIAKAHLLAERRAETLRLPATGRPVGWATFDPGAADEAAGQARRDAEARTSPDGGNPP
jgi:multicomponent K+:H+ antiporter subunit G